MDLRKLKEPFVIILIGVPLSGKSTWIRDNFPDTNVISRDEILMDVYGSRNYDLAFNRVNQKEVDRRLHQELENANKLGENVIIDMTHMVSKRRKNNLNYFDDKYFKLGVIFPILTDDEYERRNSKRRVEENKTIPMQVIKRMISQYQVIKETEGFNKVISI